MNRREFFARAAGVVMAAVGVKALPAVLPPTPDDLSISIKMLRSFNAQGMEITRFDVLYGIGTIYHPEWSAHITDWEDEPMRLSAINRRFDPARLPA